MAPSIEIRFCDVPSPQVAHLLSEIELRYDIKDEGNGLSADESHPAKSLVEIGSSPAQDNRDHLGPSFLERSLEQREQVSCRLLLTGEKIENPVSRLKAPYCISQDSRQAAGRASGAGGGQGEDSAGGEPKTRNVLRPSPP